MGENSMQNKINGQPSKVDVGLVLINASFSGQNYLPYSVGLLQAYVQEHALVADRYDFRLPIYTRIPVQDAVDQLVGADVIGFSTYVWNIRISLEIAQKVKELSPDTLIVFGGPQVPDVAEAFLREHPFIDVVCHGEGEQVFLSILEEFPARSWDDIPSISFLQKDGTFVNHPRAVRVKDLSVIPSPYLSGVFGPLMEANPQESWLFLWETNRGCPFSCTFCDWGSAVAAKVYTFDIERLKKEIEWMAENKIEFVFCCDANYGILPRDKEITDYLADVKSATGYPQAMSIQNTKNATDRAYEIQKKMADVGLSKGVTISFQSVDPTTLESIKRKNISSDSFRELQRRFTRDRVETYTDTILGLPGETYDSFANGVSSIIEDGQHNRIVFSNLTVLPNAEMGDPEYQKKYGMIMVKSKIINIHGSLTEDEVPEIQELVIGTESMPKPDWVKTRAFAYMSALLHSDKVFQIPLILLHELCSIPYRELIEAFSECDSEDYPTISETRKFFIAKAEDIQSGGVEYVNSEEWLNIWWPTDEYMMIKLCNEEKLNKFYEEAEHMFSQILKSKFIDLPSQLLREAINLNRSLIKMPFQTEDLELKLTYNIWEFYQAVLIGEPIPIEEGDFTYLIDRTSQTWDSWDDWCREVIWYGNKKGAYLYGNERVDHNYVGHF